jgi:C1A family cysteine protease
MPRLVLISVLLAIVLGFAAAKTRAGDIETYNKFHEFEIRFNKEYSSPAERLRRFTVFRENLARAAELNTQNGDPAFGVTKFMDMTAEEFRHAYLMTPLDLAQRPAGPQITVPQVKDIPVTFDWRNKTGIVTPVKNQQQCGSCWAFSATEQIESVWALAGKTTAVLGPQQIVDCDKTCYGCGGGWTQKAFAYVISAGGQELETSYPYVAKNTKCVFNASKVAASISAWAYVSQKAGDENTTMLPFVYNTAPISVCVDASTWQLYNGGVLKTCGDQIDHCVQITGFSNVQSTDVWLVRNSWGTDWGVDGYIYVPRNKNMCAIATVATTVTAKA